jgi:antitoxin (DNA-binding transcriptional repressor) of toxin-antitoxin stability system
MIEVSLEDFEKDFDSYMDRIEAGEKFMIRRPDGRAVAAVPAKELEPLTEHMSDDEWYNLYSNHEEAS